MARGESEVEPGRPPLAARMAQALVAFDADRLEPRVVAKAKLCLLDYLACAFGSRDLPWTRQAIAVATRWPLPAGEPAATILGTAHAAAAPEAAFANAVLGHGLVRDDMHLGSVSHLGVVVLAPLIALAETHAVSGRRFVAAIAAGYEAGGKLGREILDVEVSRIFRPTGITGPFAGSAACAALLGLDEAETLAALALAANTSAGYNEWAATGGSEMFFHPGFAARNAITAVELAREGARASVSALDGPAGMFASFHKQATSRTALPFAASPEILDVFFKEVPACNFAQSAAQAARDLAVAASFSAAEIAAVTVRVPYAARAYPGCDWPGPFEHVLQAKMSIHYNVAVALVARGFDERYYEPRANPAVLELAKRISLEVDDELTRAFPARQGAIVTVATADGRRLERAANDVAPASDALVRKRFVTAATGALGETGALRLLRLVETLDTSSDAGELGRAARAIED